METLKNFEDLNELLLETIIESRNIEPLLENVCFHNNSSKWRLFFYMEQNALRCGTLSFLSTKLVKKVIQCGTHVSKKSHEILLKTYAEQRQVLVIVNLGDTILVTDNGMMTLLLNKINRFLTEDKLLKRRIDVDDFIAKFFGYKDHDTKDNIGNNFDKRKLVHKSVRTKIGNSNQNKNVSIKNIRKDSDGNHDLVRCYHCGIGLKEWIKEDDVLTEHVKYSSACDFLIWKYGINQINRMKAALATEGNNEAGSSPPPLQYPIRSPRYQTMEARVASFELFPCNINIPHQQLAVAGLFYTGQGDLCRCFTCDGGLKDWKSGDDPIKEHATYFPNCPYINKLRGTEYVQIQQQNRTGSELMGAGATRGENAPTQSTESSPNIPIGRLTLQDTEYSSFNVSQVVQNLGYSEMDVITAKSELERKGKPYPSVEEIINTLLDIKERAKQMQAGATGQEIQPDLEAIIEENKKLSSLMYCMLCVNGEADIIFLPCTHHRTCHECAADLIFCPVCGQFIKEKVKTYRA